MAGETVSSGSSELVDKPKPRTPQEMQAFWVKEHEAATKRIKKFRKQGNQITRRFLDARGAGDLSSDADAEAEPGDTGSLPFKLNLFWTNVTTLQSMLYGSQPEIDVSREHQDPDDDIARVACLLLQRILEVDVQSSGADLATTLKACLQDRLLPGLGTARVHYDFSKSKETVMDPLTMEVEEVEKITDEWCTTNYVHWQDFLWGWGRTWREVPWVGYRSYMTKEEATKRFGAEKARDLEYKNQLATGNDLKDETGDRDQRDNVQKAEIWEFWNKADKTVYWWHKGCSKILDHKPDPYKLSGFFPSPMPMMANLTTTQFVPRADFVLAQDLYNEVDLLQTRISIITRAIKVVGVYNKNAGDSVGRMLEEGLENDLIPVDQWAMFADSGGIQGNVEWFPVQEVVQVLQVLQTVRNDTIDLLYQVTGMSDILRGGDTEQYVSDGTNQLKAKFGSIRVQALQDQFATFASDLDSLKAEIIGRHFSGETIVKQAKAVYLPEPDQDKVGQAVELIKSPEIKWRANIRPESIAMIDYAQLKSERTEYLTAISTYLQSSQAVVQAVPGSLPLLLEMMKWGLAGLKGSNYLEGIVDRAIEQAVNAPPQEDDGAKQQQAQQQLEQMKHQFEMEKIQAKAQADQAVNNQKFQMEMQKAMQDHQAKMQEAMAKSQGDLDKIQSDLRADLQVIAAKLGADLQTEAAQAEADIVSENVDHENNMELAETQHQHAMKQVKAQPSKEPSSDA
jgi:hypothetical protein